MNLSPETPLTLGDQQPAATAPCRNCSTTVAGRYCAACGQPTYVKRLALRELWNEFSSRVLGFDGKLPRTLRDLTLRPGLVARSYIEGNRVAYYGPIGYFFLVVTLFLILLSFADVSFETFMAGQQLVEPGEQTEVAQRINAIIQRWIGQNIRSFSFAIAPIVGLFALLMFRKSKFNFLEQCVLPIYISGHTYWITIISLLLFKIAAVPFLGWVGMAATLFFYGMGYAQLMRHQSKGKAFTKGIVLFLISYLFFLLIFTISAVVVMFTDPEIVEMLRQAKEQAPAR